MAKTKSKKKNQRGEANIFGNAGTTFLTILVGAIVESVVERLLQQVSSNNSNNIGDDNSDSSEVKSEVQQHRDRARDNPIKTVVSKLRDNVGNAKLTRKELIQVVRSFAQDPTLNLTDVVDTIKDVTRQAVQSSINNIGNEAEVAFEEATGTLKNVTNAIEPNDIDTSGKKDKKKGKKKKKK